MIEGLSWKKNTNVIQKSFQTVSIVCTDNF